MNQQTCSSAQVEDNEKYKLLATYDWRFTEAAQRTFQDKCYQALADAQVNGKGYFMEAAGGDLGKALGRALVDGDYVAVANYAMMMHTRQQIAEEKEAWNK